MKQLIKKTLPFAPPLYWFLRKILRGKGRASSMKDIFSDIHSSNAWLGSESISGPGSDTANTAALRREVPVLLRELNVRTLLDAPCGDLNWMKEVNGAVERYIGADVVPEVIERNRSLYSDPRNEFALLDITANALPRVDLIVCRDCLVHFSYEHIYAALQSFKRSGSKHLLTTTFTDPRPNADIATGAWRPLNLQLAPFYFPAPRRIINEEYRGDGGIYADKSLALWDLADLDPEPILQKRGG